MSLTPRGVRSINERLLQENRALIMTNKNKDDLLKIWNEIPDGTIHVDTASGLMSIKLAGKTSWTPYGIDADKTLVISRDTQFNEETFIILDINPAEGSFVYENSKGKKTHSECSNAGNDFLFILEKGSYMMGRNHLEVTLDDCLIRTVMSGGIQEVTDQKFKILDELSVGQKVTVRYVKWTKIGNPYPRFFLGQFEPESADIGDFWLDPNGQIDEGSVEEILEDDPAATIDWAQITGLPTTLAGYGITDKVSLIGHVHRTLDITDFPSSLPANGGDSETVSGKRVGNAPGEIPVLDDLGKLNISVFPTSFLTASKALYIQDSQPLGAAENAIWFCTKADSAHIEVFKDGTWLKIGAVWK